jgi:DNA topoisomerase I
MDLIIVESPTKARTLGRFLGDKYIVDSTMGHIRDLPKSKLGVDVDHNFDPQYVDVPKKEETVKKIKADAKRADRVYLATDPDREGEAISYHVAEILNEGKKTETKFSRIVFHEITENAVKEALSHPRPIDIPLVDAQQARRVLDRLVGYKLSPLLWKKIRKGLSAGRVQSVAVRLIVEREREIEAFKAIEYWDISADVKAEKGNFTVKLVKIGDKKAVVSNGEESSKVVSDLEKAEYKILTVEKREAIRRPPAPFTTSTMTQSASRSLGWSAKKTMSVAQKLYEEGLITYHRTDSTNLAKEAITMVRNFIQNEYPEKFLPKEPRIYKTSSKVAQEAHEAIRPTHVNKQPSAVGHEMGRDGEMLYGLIWRRFVACQLADCIFDETTVNVQAKEGPNYSLQAKGLIMKFEGWRKVYGRSLGEEGEVQLPDVNDGEALQLIKVNAAQMFTQPPARFTEATLVKTLEKLGIGRPSTYAPTLSTIQDRQYVEKIESKFQPTSLGIAVNDFLIKNFKDVFEYNFTAGMEDDLDKIAEGKKEWVPVIREFWKPFETKIELVDDRAERVKIEVEKTGKKCPTCGEGDEIIRVGKFGKFLSCSRFPDCKYTAPFIEEANIKCPDCKTGEVIIKKTKRGKRFFGCSNYPKCKWASWRKPTSEAPIKPVPAKA